MGGWSWQEPWDLWRGGSHSPMIRSLPGMDMAMVYFSWVWPLAFPGLDRYS